MKTYGKFAALIVVIAGTLIWLAAGGVRERGTYYKTIGELRDMGSGALGKRLRVGGDVETGSIVRTGRAVAFTLQQDKLRPWRTAGWTARGFSAPAGSRPSAPPSTRRSPERGRAP
jgi:hypothetical protein